MVTTITMSPVFQGGIARILSRRARGASVSLQVASLRVFKPLCQKKDPFFAVEFDRAIPGRSVTVRPKTAF